jgi:hypothetical protein
MGRPLTYGVLHMREWLPVVWERLKAGERLTTKQVSEEYRIGYNQAASALSVLRCAGLLQGDLTKGRSAGCLYYVNYTD